MTEYEEKITSTFKEIGFKVFTNEDIDGMHKVLSQKDEFIGYLVVSSGFCTIGNGIYSILFHDAKMHMGEEVIDQRCLRLFKDENYVGSINL